MDVFFIVFILSDIELLSSFLMVVYACCVWCFTVVASFAPSAVATSFST